MTTSLQDHFGLQEVPFPKAASEACLLRHPPLAEAVERLRFALTRDSPALLVAESGCGKSTAAALFARSLDAASYHVLYLCLTTVKPFGFVSQIAAASGLRSGRFKSEVAASLIAHLRSLPKRTVLLVDEAHLLPDDSLEDLRLLTTDDFDRRSPFALVLVGQPLLRDRLGEPQHYALAQRIGVRLRLRPLSESELPLFLDRHMKAAGAQHNPFDPDATAVIFHHSRGIPRLVQNVGLEALFAAMAAGKKTVDATSVQQAVVDMEAL
ncbi:MAG: AAA family ATPase [Candidatus Riflebacteria bacterium]|nr:AAA family ATPase [Candidatus Riflebacteria bacterium]